MNRSTSPTRTVKYVSTRGQAPALGFGDVLLQGMAPDGGLYVPDFWPGLPAKSMSDDYRTTAFEVMWPFVAGSIEADDFGEIIATSYEQFECDDVVELVDLGDGLWVLELFHGPTLAFKDVALQLVGNLFEHELARRGQAMTVVAATSGDTGSAAIEACRNREGLDIFVLHPQGRVSEVQRRQMTTVDSSNVHNIAIEGSFDDCQDLVKAMFADTSFSSELGLGAVNSINWARVMAQIVYYVVARNRIEALASPLGQVTFCVPTGNFGNVFAGWAARQMGLPIHQLRVASNRNDILTRFFRSGEMNIAPVEPTLSPSMDIQVSSNLERLLFELVHRDGSRVNELMRHFRNLGSVSIDTEMYQAIAESWTATRVDDEGLGGTLDTISAVFDRSGYLLDPHNAVGVAAAMRQPDTEGARICLATAHPAKFPDAIERAIGTRPTPPMRVAKIFERQERYEVMPPDLGKIQEFIRHRH